jgi:hypothetical protein
MGSCFPNLDVKMRFLPDEEFQNLVKRENKASIRNYEGTQVGLISYKTALLVRHRRPYRAHSDLPLKPSDLGYSPGQPFPIFTAAYKALIPKERLRQPILETKSAVS